MIFWTDLLCICPILNPASLDMDNYCYTWRATNDSYKGTIISLLLCGCTLPCLFHRHITSSRFPVMDQHTQVFLLFCHSKLLAPKFITEIPDISPWVHDPILHSLEFLLICNTWVLKVVQLLFQCLPYPAQILVSHKAHCNTAGCLKVWLYFGPSPVCFHALIFHPVFALMLSTIILTEKESKILI